MVQTIVALLALLVFGAVLVFIGYAIGKNHAKKGIGETNDDFGVSGSSSIGSAWD